MAKKKTTRAKASKKSWYHHDPLDHEKHPNLLWLLILFVLVLFGVFALKVFYLDSYYSEKIKDTTRTEMHPMNGPHNY